MKRILPLAAALLWACTATAPPPSPVPPPPKPPAPSLDELQQTFVPRIEDNQRSVDSYEARKEEIIERKLEDLERLRELHEVRRAEIDSKREKIALLEARLADRRAQLKTPSAAPQGALEREIEKKIADTEREIERESAELDRRLAEAANADKEIERLEAVDRDGLFLDEMQPLYREGIELHLGFYRGVIELAREQLTPGDEASVLVDHFTGRMMERGRLLERDLGADAFATLSHEFELDRRMSQAWLSAFILEVRFSINEFRLDTISDEEQDELQLLAESLEATWNENPNLEMYIDGHADSKQFRGRTPCVSATLNRDLSRHRAEAVRDFFRQRLDGDAGRIHLDWFGNFSPHTASQGDDLSNRRIELRITARRADDSFDSHRDYFSMRRVLEIGGRSFQRAQGMWIESSCQGRDFDVEVEYLSDGYGELVERLGLADASARLRLGADGREIGVLLGNAFAVDDAGQCVSVRPCPEGAP